MTTTEEREVIESEEWWARVNWNSDDQPSDPLPSDGPGDPIPGDEEYEEAR